MLVSELRSQGEWLFSWRSYLPVPIYLAGLALIVFGPPGGGWAGRGDWYGYLCLAIALAGALFRFYVRGIVPGGTSGRNTRGQVATTLNTQGGYSLVRHPLYLGNVLIYLGVSLYPGVWWFGLFVALVCWLYYERIMVAEEAFLAEKFGETYREWAARVPAFLPRLSGWARADAPFRVAVALRRERSSIMGVGLGFGLYVLAERWSGRPPASADWFWAGLAGLTVLLYAIGKLGLKKR